MGPDIRLMANEAVVLEKECLNLVRRLTRGTATHISNTGDEAMGSHRVRVRTCASAGRLQACQEDYPQSEPSARVRCHYR